MTLSSVMLLQVSSTSNSVQGVAMGRACESEPCVNGVCVEREMVSTVRARAAGRATCVSKTLTRVARIPAPMEVRVSTLGLELLPVAAG